MFTIEIISHETNFNVMTQTLFYLSCLMRIFAFYSEWLLAVIIIIFFYKSLGPSYCFNKLELVNMPYIA